MINFQASLLLTRSPMKKLTSAWSHIKTSLFSGMSLPSRLSLWLGVGLVAWGHTQREVGLMVIGSLFIVGGAVLWWMYKGNEWVNRRKRKARKRTQPSKMTAAQSLEMIQSAQKNKSSSAPSEHAEHSRVIEDGRNALKSLQLLRQKMGWDKHSNKNDRP